MKTRLKHLSKGIGQYGANIAATEYVEDGCRFLRTTDITEDGDLKQDGDGVFIAQEAARGYLLGEGDLLFSRSGTIGRSYLHQGGEGEQFAFAGYLVRFTPGTDADPRFLFHASRSAPFQGQISADSIQTTISNFNAEKYGNLELWLPPLPTQRAIAAFLDRKTAAIDDLIDKKERLIKLLAEKRAALIHRAVTKGLDDGVPMKDSGVPAFPRLPSHWSTTKPKYACHKIVDGTHHTPTYVEEGVPFITVKNLTAGPGISFAETKFVSEDEHGRLWRRASPERGDVLISKDGTLGVTRVIETDRVFSIFVSVALLKLQKQMLDPWFLRFAFESEALWQQFEARKSGSGLKHLILTDIGNVDVPQPPLSEQQEIAAFIREGAGRFDSLTETTRQNIDKLREYRQALITAAVTGQVEVPAEDAA